MNVIAITGNLCKDVELKYTGNNKSVVENTLAVQKGNKNADGNYDVDFIDFVCFEKKADYLSQFAKKGNKIEITGKLRADNWKDKEGNSRSRTYVVADTLKILASKPKEEKEKTNPFEITDDDYPF